MFWILISEACTSIFSQRLRTILAMTGILIGVSSVVLMVAIADGSKAAIEEKVKKLGTNVLIVTPGSRDVRGRMMMDTKSLAMADAEAVATLPGVVAASPASTGLSYTAAFEKQNVQARVFGVYPSMLQIRSWPLASGTNFNEDDVKGSVPVAVIGFTIKIRLFLGQDEIGKTIRIDNQPFQVIGTLAPKGQGLDGQDQDDIIFVPITALKAKLWKFGSYMSVVQSIHIQAASQDQMQLVTEEVHDLLQQRHTRGSNTTKYNVRSLTSVQEAAKETNRTFTLLIGGIAAISLLVGGIGIMNIMLVTVTERTREIGIRKAIGATSMNILVQFLLEAVMIAGVGSVAGLVAGVAGGIVASGWFSIPTAFTLTPVFMALVVAVVVGVFSGLYPAYKASNLQPIEALRSVGG